MCLFTIWRTSQKWAHASTTVINTCELIYVWSLDLWIVLSIALQARSSQKLAFSEMHFVGSVRTTQRLTFRRISLGWKVGSAVSISVNVSLRVRCFSSSEIATVLQILVRCGSSAEWCRKRRYCLFSRHKIVLWEAGSTFTGRIPEGGGAEIEVRDSR
jgi:hypothetical protein